MSCFAQVVTVFCFALLSAVWSLCALALHVMIYFTLFIFLAIQLYQLSSNLIKNSILKHYPQLENNIDKVVSNSKEAYEIRNKQIQQRAMELELTYSFLSQNANSNSYCQLSDNQSATSIVGSILSQVDLKHVFLQGHSFGAGTIVQSLFMRSSIEEQKRFSGIILLDTWFYPTSRNVEKLKIEIPALVIHSSVCI